MPEKPQFGSRYPRQVKVTKGSVMPAPAQRCRAADGLTERRGRPRVTSSCAVPSPRPRSPIPPKKASNIWTLVCFFQLGPRTSTCPHPPPETQTGRSWPRVSPARPLTPAGRAAPGGRHVCPHPLMTELDSRQRELHTSVRPFINPVRSPFCESNTG